MSQMGHSRRFDGLPTISGFPPETDINRPTRLVRFVPTPDMISLLDHLVGAVQHRWRDFEAKRFGGLEIDHQLECGRLLNWYIA